MRSGEPIAGGLGLVAWGAQRAPHDLQSIRTESRARRLLLPSAERAVPSCWTRLAPMMADSLIRNISDGDLLAHRGFIATLVRSPEGRSGLRSCGPCR